MKNNNFIETCIISCCAFIVLCFTYLFWGQYSTTLKAGDVGIFFGAIGAFIATSLIYLQFKETQRQFSRQHEESDKRFQEYCGENRKNYEESQKQFQEMFKESQNLLQKQLEESQTKSALAQEQYNKSQEQLQDRFNDGLERFQEQFNDNQKRFQELSDEMRKQRELNQERSEENLKRSSLLSYQSVFFGLYDREALYKELIEIDKPAVKSAPPVLLGLLELVRINLLNQIIDTKMAAWNLEMILRDDFDNRSRNETALLKYNLKTVLLKYGLDLLERDEDVSDFLEVIFKLKKMRIREVNVESVRAKLDIMKLADQV